MDFSDRLKYLRKKKNLTQYQMARDLELSISTMAMWESSQRKPPAETLIRLAKYFDVSVDYLLGADSFPDGESVELIRYPVIAKVKAGYDHCFTEIESGEYQEVPRSILNSHTKDDMMVFLVDGDSMAPKFLNGDRVLVSRQTSVNSGDIAIVSYYDYENGTVKKVHYEVGCDYIDLIPLNSNYSPVRIQGDALQGVRILGKVVYLFRKI